SSLAGPLSRRLGREPLPEPAHRLPGVQEPVDARLLLARRHLGGDPLSGPLGAAAAACAARGMITSGTRIDGDLNLSAEVCVIGSGAGGAVVAKELAEAGRDVVLLEQGGHYTKDDFTQREDEMLPLLYEDMGQRATV